MPYETIGGVVGVVLVVWYVAWRVGFIRELARRAGLSHERYPGPPR
jgi:hypothetical protein